MFLCCTYAVQLSYSWLRASDYSTNVRSVDFETIESLVARVGIMGGIKFNENRGAAYLKASYNHDWVMLTPNTLLSTAL